MILDNLWKNRLTDQQGCLESLEPLRYYPAFTTDGGEGPLSSTS